jgi:hypothetical protein
MMKKMTMRTILRMIDASRRHLGLKFSDSTDILDKLEPFNQGMILYPTKRQTILPATSGMRTLAKQEQRSVLPYSKNYS